MSLLFFRSADFGGDRASFQLGWDTAWAGDPSNNYAANQGRLGTGYYAWYHKATSFLDKFLPSASQTIIVGCAFKMHTSIVTDGNLISLFSGINRHLYVFLDYATGNILVKNNAGSTLGTDSGGYARDTWHYVEIKAYIHDSTGTIEVKVNGTTTINLTSQDTYNNSGNAEVDRVIFGEVCGNTSAFYTCDWYVCDTAGSTNNDFLDQPLAVVLKPDGAGNYSQFTPSAGSNYENVDDYPPDEDTTYNETATVGNRDSVGTDASVSTSSVYGVQVSVYGRATEGGIHKVAPFVRLSSTDLDGTAQPLTTIYDYLHHIFETKPGGGAWSASDVNSVEIGYSADSR